MCWIDRKRFIYRWVNGDVVGWKKLYLKRGTDRDQTKGKLADCYDEQRLKDIESFHEKRNY